MGVTAAEVAAVADKAARLKRFVAVPLAQRYQPFATRARELARSHTSTLGGAPWPSCCSTIRGPVSAV